MDCTTKPPVTLAGMVFVPHVCDDGWIKMSWPHSRQEDETPKKKQFPFPTKEMIVDEPDLSDGRPTHRTRTACHYRSNVGHDANKLSRGCDAGEGGRMMEPSTKEQVNFGIGINSPTIEGNLTGGCSAWKNKAIIHQANNLDGDTALFID